MIKKVLLTSACVLWLAILTAVMIQTVGPHYLPMPAAFGVESIDFQDGQAETAAPHVFHFLTAGCGCSFATAEYLAQRDPIKKAQERIILSGQDPDIEALFSEGTWDFSIRKADQIEAEFGVSGGPWLIVASSLGTVRYSGGYGPRPVFQPKDFNDLKLISEIAQGNTPVPYPAFGCAASSNLKEQLTLIDLRIFAEPTL